ncbi:MAG: AMP-binding protein [Candidatus Hydrogenedentota bacterium]
MSFRKPSVLGQAIQENHGVFLDRTGAEDSPITFEETRRTAARICSYVRKRGVTRGDTVAVAMSNSAPVAIIWFGLLTEGISVVPLNPVLPDEEIAYILRMSEAKLIFADKPFMPKAQRWAEEIGSRIEAVAADDEPWSEYTEAEPHYVDPEDIAVIFFTSGTTGRPKGAMLSHRALIENAIGCAKSYGLDSSAAFACPIPIFHAFAATVCLFLPAIIGARTYLHSPLDPKGFVETVPKLERRRIIVAVPSVLEAIELLSQGKLDQVAFTVSGGASLPEQLRDRVAAATRVAVYEGYGTTECGPVITSQAPGRINAPGSVGFPIAGVEIEIRSSDGDALPFGSTGEIVVRTSGLMSGYYDLATATKASVKGGWFYTGDLGYVSEAGELFIVDRLTDAITVKGITLLPQTVEHILNRHADVAEAAIVGIPDGAGGEAPWAFVRLKASSAAAPPDPADLIRFCRERLPIYAVPRGVEFRDTLPKTITGKILKRTLRQKWL